MMKTVMPYLHNVQSPPKVVTLLSVWKNYQNILGSLNIISSIFVYTLIYTGIYNITNIAVTPKKFRRLYNTNVN